ncbi:TonB-dependent receptor [Stakelama saccharophila]|uniref:TonB-dependent receptor n=1 Tax=Stakelama saccharophila TaxID=3075605 RepID=A0ABZ0BCM7_9SPHN|nr:TonB-dependent receptor [Stakelama sp. W311]WNO54820.1 TonB-dependent receptor [Stakelama sp. W311]
MAVLAIGTAQAQDLSAQEDRAASQEGEASANAPATYQADDSYQSVDQAPETIVVTGYRASLDAALDLKRQSDSAIDAIVAEDIAKFPDQNLAESLQRIPGIAIERDAGEGRAITVRGLGAQFTRVRVNGMETIATSTDGASANRDRAFDFNVFASELFTSIVVHKTAEAALDEGSLGAVVDLNTGNPLAYGRGVTLTASAQARYNDLNDDVGPRLAGLLGWVNDDETFGVSASIAYSQYKTPELGNNSVRWAQAPFRSVDGVACDLDSPTGACAEVADAFHPRIPRYGLVAHDRKRLGATASLQWKPTDRTTLSIDGLYSNFKEQRDEHWGEVLLRSNEDGIDLSNYVIDDENNIISADLDNVYVRTERYHRESETEFYQLSGKLEQEFSDRFSATLRGGFSQSDADIPIETSLMFDNRDATGYSYDYTDMKSPVLSFGSEIEDPGAFQFAEFRDRPSTVTNKFRTAALDLNWQVTDGFELTGGPFYRRFDFDTVGYRRDSTYCNAFACEAGQYGAPVTEEFSDIFHLGEAGQPEGNTNAWVEPNLQGGTDFLDLYNREAVVDEGDKRSVTEESSGGWFQANFETHLLGLRVTGNAGMRYANTDQASQGFVSGEYVTVKRSYDDWLPAMNINFHPTDDLIVRGAIAKVMTRPSLGSLTPGGSVDEFNFRISSGNPFIDPYRATNYDVAVEWYFAPSALASVALFKKDIVSFPLGSTREGTYASSGLPTSILTPGTPVYDAIVNGTDPDREFEFRTTINGPGASLKGVELALNLPFSIFSESLRSFGVLGNLTLVDSDVDYTVNGDVYTRPLLGLSKKSANGTVYYDDGTFSIRVSGAYREGYLTSTSGNSNIFEGYGSSFNLDAAIRYALTDQIELSLDGTNLTDDYRYRFVDDFARRNYENNHYGRVIMAGVRFKL